MEICYLAWILFEDIFYVLFLFVCFFVFKTSLEEIELKTEYPPYIPENLSTEVEGRKQSYYW